MADFDYAIKIVLKHEGGYSNHPNDTGKETYRGISRKHHPNWQGWEIVDSCKPLKDEEIIKDPELEKAVARFYYKNFWEPNDLAYVQDDNVAKKILDMSVNMGSTQAITLVQRALEDFGLPVNEDGKMGPVTYNAINSLDAGMLYNKLKAESEKFYRALVIKHPKNKVFLNNWVKRANE